jgi:hypothetical protein
MSRFHLHLIGSMQVDAIPGYHDVLCQLCLRMNANSLPMSQFFDRSLSEDQAGTRVNVHSILPYIYMACPTGLKSMDAVGQFLITVGYGLGLGLGV